MSINLISIADYFISGGSRVVAIDRLNKLRLFAENGLARGKAKIASVNGIGSTALCCGASRPAVGNFAFCTVEHEAFIYWSN